MAMNTTSTWSYEVNQYFDRKNLLVIDNNTILDKYAEKRNIPKNNTRTIMFERIGNFDELGELTEGVTPDGIVLSKSNITAQIKQYGGLTIVTDVMEETLLKKTFSTMQNRLAEAAARTRDILIRDSLYASTVHFASDATDTNDNINTTYDGTTFTNVNGGLTGKNVLAIVQTLFNAKAQQFTNIMVGKDRYLTSPLGASYIAIVPSQAMKELYKDPDFVKVENYASPEQRLPFEIGAMNGARFIISHNFTQLGNGTAVGANGKPVYRAIFVGKEAYATIDLANGGIKTYNYNFGHGEDYLHQRAVAGTKFWHASTITNNDWLIAMDFEA